MPSETARKVLTKLAFTQAAPALKRIGRDSLHPDDNRPDNARSQARTRERRLKQTRIDTAGITIDYLFGNRRSLEESNS
jgi:hypothetical protein